jgi:hypothetical protein
MTGEAMQQILDDAYAMPKALMQRAVELHGSAVN